MAKKLILVAVVGFLGFWMFTDPNGLAATAQAGAAMAWGLTQQLFRAVIRFLDALT